MKVIKIETRPATGYTATLVGAEGWLVEFPNGERQTVNWETFVLQFRARGAVARGVIETAAQALEIDIDAILLEADVAGESLDAATEPA